MRKRIISWLLLAFVAALLGYLYAGFRQSPKAESFNQDGAVIFWQDTFGVGPIYRRTGSRLTHAAVILGDCVYEAVPPCVRKVRLSEYLEEMKHKRGAYFILRPKTPYTSNQTKAMTKYAESQLGRKYMLRGFDKRETVGIFCSWYAANVLEKGGRIRSDQFRESPGSLYRKLESIYVR